VCVCEINSLGQSWLPASFKPFPGSFRPWHMRQIDNTFRREHSLWSQPRNFVHHTVGTWSVSRARDAAFGFVGHGTRLLFGRRRRRRRVVWWCGGVDGRAFFLLGLCFVLGAPLISQELVEGERVQNSSWTAALTASALWGITHICKDFFFLSYSERKNTPCLSIVRGRRPGPPRYGVVLMKPSLTLSFSLSLSCSSSTTSSGPQTLCRACQSEPVPGGSLYLGVLCATSMAVCGKYVRYGRAPTGRH
jgi:hypothetical protein